MRFIIFPRKGYKKETIQDYYNIPENDRLFFELIIRNATLKEQGRNAIIDLGFRKNEVNLESGGFYNRSSISDLGDLSIFKGYVDIDASGMSIVNGTTYPQVFENYEALQKENLYELVDRGFTNFRLKMLPAEEVIYSLPIKLQTEDQEINNTITYGGNPNFFLHKDGVIQYVISNGKSFKMSDLKNYKWLKIEKP